MRRTFKMERRTDWLALPDGMMAAVAVICEGRNRGRILIITKKEPFAFLRLADPSDPGMTQNAFGRIVAESGQEIVVEQVRRAVCGKTFARLVTT